MSGAGGMHGAAWASLPAACILAWVRPGALEQGSRVGCCPGHSGLPACTRRPAPARQRRCRRGSTQAGRARLQRHAALPGPGPRQPATCAGRTSAVAVRVAASLLILLCVTAVRVVMVSCCAAPRAPLLLQRRAAACQMSTASGTSCCQRAGRAYKGPGGALAPSQCSLARRARPRLTRCCFNSCRYGHFLSPKRRQMRLKMVCSRARRGTTGAGRVGPGAVSDPAQLPGGFRSTGRCETGMAGHAAQLAHPDALKARLMHLAAGSLHGQVAHWGVPGTACNEQSHPGRLHMQGWCALLPAEGHNEAAGSPAQRPAPRRPSGWAAGHRPVVGDSWCMGAWVLATRDVGAREVRIGCW